MVDSKHVEGSSEGGPGGAGDCDSPAAFSGAIGINCRETVDIRPVKIKGSGK